MPIPDFQNIALNNPPPLSRGIPGDTGLSNVSLAGLPGIDDQSAENGDINAVPEVPPIDPASQPDASQPVLAGISVLMQASRIDPRISGPLQSFIAQVMPILSGDNLQLQPGQLAPELGGPSVGLSDNLSSSVEGEPGISGLLEGLI